MAIRFIKFPEVENGKDRTALEFAWLERQQAEEQKKNQQNYINFGELPDDIVKPAVLWAYYQGLSVLPRDGHVYFQTVTIENQDGAIEVIALQPKIQYAGEIYLAVHGENARYRAVEMLIDGRRLGAENMDNIAFGLNSQLTVRVVDMANKARSITQTIGVCFQHGLEYSPTLGKFKKDLNKFWAGYEKYRKGDTSLFNPWYANPLAMSAKTLWRKIDGQDKITTYSEEYLEEVREATVTGLALPEIKVDFETGEILELDAPVPMITGEVVVEEEVAPIMIESSEVVAPIKDDEIEI
ncbi:MAG: hypothetical protein WC292_00290 [Clostridia bacterium]